jgi:hypothetical protein
MCILDLGVASLVKYCLVFNNSIGGGGGGGGGGLPGYRFAGWYQMLVYQMHCHIWTICHYIFVVKFSIVCLVCGTRIVGQNTAKSSLHYKKLNCNFALKCVTCMCGRP